MPQYQFGSGVMWGVKEGSTSSPIKFGALQGASLDFQFNTKELYGSYQFPIAVGRGTAKVSGRAQFAQLNGLVINDLFLNSSVSMAKSQLNTVDNEAGTITAGAVTIADFPITQDLGVIYASNGLPFEKVASAPDVGQYSVNLTTGVYSFSTLENDIAVYISYTYMNPAKVITSSSIADPTIITATAHDLGAVGDLVRVVIAGHVTAVPDINAEWTATILSANTLSIPVEVTTGGTGGTITRTGRVITINQQLLGTAPAFALTLNGRYSTKKVTLALNRCMSGKFGLQTRLEDFTIPDFDFSAFADDAGVLGYMSLAE